MAKYIAKRVALALVTLVIVSMLTFFLMFLVPGGPDVYKRQTTSRSCCCWRSCFVCCGPVV